MQSLHGGTAKIVAGRMCCEVRELKRKLYPLYLKITGDIGNGVAQGTTGEGIFIESFGAIEVEVKINSANYPKELVYEAVKETVLEAAEYFRNDETSTTSAS